MKVAVIGANGQIGRELCELGSAISYEMVPLMRCQVDVTSIESVKEALIFHRPDAVINTAALMPSDRCEEVPDEAFRTNALGARNVAVVAQEIGAKLVFISTNYVFNGESPPKMTPYTEFDEPVPPNVYGRSKLAGEKFVQLFCSRHFIIRSSAFFGVGSVRNNFVETILRLSRERPELRVVDDQSVSPTYARDLARKIMQLIITDYYGTFHITNKGACTWYQFACEILKLVGSPVPVIPITTNQYPQKSRRPSNGIIDNYHLRLLGMDDLPPWQEALRDYLVAKGHIDHQ